MQGASINAGIDIGGTFTDLILVDSATGDFVIRKTLTTPQDPSQAIETLLVEGGDPAARVGTLIASVNGVAVAEHPFARALLDAGFSAVPLGFNVRRNLPGLPGRAAQ